MVLVTMVCQWSTTKMIFTFDYPRNLIYFYLNTFSLHFDLDFGQHSSAWRSAIDYLVVRTTFGAHTQIKQTLKEH
jgi:hypothetical protein